MIVVGLAVAGQRLHDLHDLTAKGNRCAQLVCHHILRTVVSLGKICGLLGCWCADGTPVIIIPVKSDGFVSSDVRLPDDGGLDWQVPSRVRYKVLALCCTLAMITYLDRACFGASGSLMVRDLHLASIASLRWAFAAFTLAYALFEVPSGWLGDVFGPRKVLIRIVLWWSFFTALTGVIGLSLGGYVLGGLGVLVIVRFLFGIGEAGAFPNITRALHNWFPYHQRGLAQGTVWMCARLMGGLTPLVFTVLVSGVSRPAAGPTAGNILPFLLPPLLSWRAVFWVFGLVGVLWCVVFALSFRNRPEEKPEVNAAELAIIRAAAPTHCRRTSVFPGDGSSLAPISGCFGSVTPA